MLREGMEDYARHKSDDELNASKCVIYKQEEFKEFTWKDIKVGELVKVVDNEFFPADLVLVGSAHETGACYIETASLDGEKNLKPRSCPKETMNLVLLDGYKEMIVGLEGTISCNLPNS